MSEYDLFVPLIEEYFREKVIYGTTWDGVKVYLLDVKPKRLCGLIKETAVYDISVIEETDRTATIRMFAQWSVGKLNVRKKKGKLLVDLMTHCKKIDGETFKLTLENSFVVPLNKNYQ